MAFHQSLRTKGAFLYCITIIQLSTLLFLFLLLINLVAHVVVYIVLGHAQKRGIDGHGRLRGIDAGGALLLFLTNLVTIALTAAVMARLYGFGGHLSPSQTRLQGLLIILGLVALAVPLGIALRQIAWEALAQRQVREAIRASFPREARISQLDIDFAGRPERIRAVVFTPVLRADGDAMAGTAIRAALARAPAAWPQPETDKVPSAQPA